MFRTNTFTDFLQKIINHVFDILLGIHAFFKQPSRDSSTLGKCQDMVWHGGCKLS